LVSLSGIDGWWIGTIGKGNRGSRGCGADVLDDNSRLRLNLSLVGTINYEPASYKSANSAVQLIVGVMRLGSVSWPNENVWFARLWPVIFGMRLVVVRCDSS